MATARITKITVDQLDGSKGPQLLWDITVKGFGVKASNGGTKTYVVQYRTAGGRSGLTRRLTIGRHGSPWTAESARIEAKRILGLVAHGQDPVDQKRALRQAATVAELCDQYMKDGTGTKKESTLATDQGRIERHIKPLLGKRKVAEVTQGDIRKFLKDVAEGVTRTDVKTKVRGRAMVKGGRGTASRTVGLLGGIFSYAIDLGIVAINPVHGVKRYPDRKNERFLSVSELGILGKALNDAEQSGVNAKALSIIKLLIFTGARRGEIEGLRWTEVDFVGQRLRLADSKTGQKGLPLNSAAAKILKGLVHEDGNIPVHVFPATKGDGHYTGTPHIWAKLRIPIGMSDVRLHDLRHSFASVGVAGGASLMIVGSLLGHANHSTTQRYAHLADNPVAAASEVIGNAMISALRGDG